MNEKKSLYKTYVKQMGAIKDPYFKNVNKDLLAGQNSYLRMRMKGSSSFNDEWILKIEDCIYELGQIINNPLEVTKTEGEITPVELAKKINYESIQHLASHTQFIKEIDENGNVVPSKILSQFHKEELHTYENRFIATFVRRLVLFVEKRYEFIKNTITFDTKDILYVKNKSIVDGQEVSIETKVTLKRPNEDVASETAREFVKRVENMRRYVNYFYNSPLMKELKTEKNVRKPILQTNIIRKNPYYRKCYETFLFIEKFSSLGIEYTLDEKYQDFDEKERKNLNYILTSNLLSLEATEKSKVYKSATKTYKPKLLSSIDDEVFTYGSLVKGPIEFVRVDEKYTEWLNANVSTKIPAKPNKGEKEFFKEEIEHKRNVKKHIDEVDALLRRIRRQIAQWEKKVVELIEQRKIEDAKAAAAELEALRKEENRILDRKRKEIMAAARDEKSEIKERELAEIQRIKEEQKRREEEIRRQIEEAAAKAREEIRLVEEAARKAAEEEAARLAAEEEAARKAKEEEEARLAAKEAAKLAAEEEAKTEAESEPVIEEQSVAEETVVEEPVEQPVEEVPVEPSTEEQPANEEQTKEEIPVVEEVTSVEETIEVAEETPTEEPAPLEGIVVEESIEQPVEEVSAEPAIEVQSVIEEPASEEIPVTEEVASVEKPAPIEEGKAEQPQEKPVKEEAKPKKAVSSKKSSGKTGKNSKSKAKKSTKKSTKKAVKKPETPKVEESAKEEPVEQVAKIPGRFIVKSNKGYVISKSEFTSVKSQAHVFDDFNDARRYKTLFGGKVIKL